MDLSNHFPIFHNGYRLEAFPWSQIPENLINSVKTDVSTFRTKNVWYGMDVYVGKRNGTPFSRRFVNSSTKAGLLHYVSFLTKLYWWRVSFSSAQVTLPETFPNRRSVAASKRSKIFRTKSAGSVGWDDFEGSSSFVSSLVSEWVRFIEQGNGLIKTSFSFTDATGWYSEIVEAVIKERRKYGMTPEEKVLFEENEKKKPFVRFLFQWKISASGVSQGFDDFLNRTLRWYATDQNRYAVFPEGKRQLPWKRLIESERLLSHGLLVPLSNPCQASRKVPILPIPSSSHSDGFVVKPSFI